MGFPPQGPGNNDNCTGCSVNSEGFFCQLSDTTKQAFERIKLTTHYSKGAILFAEGERPRGVFMLCRGRVKLSVCAADGKMLILRIVESGAMLGLSANVSNLPFEVTAEALEPCQVDFLDNDSFHLFLRSHGDACLGVAQHLSQNYHTAYAQIRSLGLSNSALEKLARLLLEWCNGNGAGADQEIPLKIGLTHEDIARMIGTSRETVTRLFRELKDRQTIYLKGSTLIVRDRIALERLVNT